MRARFSFITQSPTRGVVAILSSILAGICLGYLAGFDQSWLLPVAPVAIGMVAWMIFCPDIATLIFTFLFYTNTLVVASTFYGVPRMISGGFFLILLLPLSVYVVFQRQSIVFTRTLIFMLVYLLAMLVSTIAAQSYAISLTSITDFLLEGLVLYFLITNVIRTPMMVKRVMWVLILAGAIMGALTIYQGLTHAYGSNFGGFGQVDTGGFKVGENLFGNVIQPRLAGPIGEKNRYAQVLIVLFPLAFFRFLQERNIGLKLFAAGATLLILGATLLTFSRGALLALIGLLVIMTVLKYIRKTQILLLLLIVISLAIIVAPGTIDRVTSFQGVAGLFSDDAENPDGAILGRVTENLAALNTLIDHPILGVGPGEFFVNYSQKYGNELGLRTLDTNRRAHNLYLEIAADSGIIGLVAFIGILVAVVLPMIRIRRSLLAHNQVDQASLVTALLLSVLAYLGTGVFLHLSYQRYFWFLLALASTATHLFESGLVATYRPNPAAVQPATNQPVVRE